MAAAEPTASRPEMPGYGVPETEKGMLPWSHAVQRLTEAMQYWVTTSNADGTPHAVPVWATWVEGALFFGGGPETRWNQNLRANPRVVVHLESGEDVVILEGTAEWFTDADAAVAKRVGDASDRKYGKGMSGPPPFWMLRPSVAFGWTLDTFPKSCTRWRFEDR